MTIVGVARDAKYATFDELTPSMVFLSIDQDWQSNQTMLVRGVSSAQLVRGLRDAMRAIDPMLPVPAVVSLDEASGITVLPQRIAVIVTGVLGSRRIDSRNAWPLRNHRVLGEPTDARNGCAHRARRRAFDGARTRVARGLRLAASGVAVGLVLSAAATRVLAGLLLNVSALDAVTFLATSALLVAVTLLATYIPARRAASLDPMTALRSE